MPEPSDPGARPDALEVPELATGRLDGRVAIVTGAGSANGMAGTGAAISIVLAARGARVVLADVDRDRAEHTREAVERVGGEGCERTRRDLGSLDILVNNAAIAPREEEFDVDSWSRIIALNLTGPMQMMAGALPAMRAQRKGSIVNITSISALQAGGGEAYTAAKSGLRGLGRAMALREGPNGIRVNDVAPGHVAIPMGLGFQGWAGDLSAGERTRRRRAFATMLGTEGTGWDVANAVAFLAGDESAYVTGVTIPVDGGTTGVFPLVMWQRINEREDAYSAGVGGAGTEE
jgi:NAD(P)-dependent dehydrogenase (short-subunit alcohol dehydrogenase family)